MKLFAVVKDGEFVRGGGQSPHIRTYKSKPRAEAYARRHVMGDYSVVEFVPKDVKLREPAINWTWEELDDHLSIFDHVDVGYDTGKQRNPHNIESGGVNVLRVIDVSPQKNVKGEVILHIGTDSQWFKREQVQLLPDSHIRNILYEFCMKHDIDKSAYAELCDAFRLELIPDEEKE